VASVQEGVILPLPIPGVQVLPGNAGLGGGESGTVHVPRREFKRKLALQMELKLKVAPVFPPTGAWLPWNLPGPRTTFLGGCAV
jgi:hypothetical protein